MESPTRPTRPEAAMIETTLELQRTQRLLRDTSLSEQGQHGTSSEMVDGDATGEQDRIKHQGDDDGNNDSSSSSSNALSDPLVEYGWQKLINIICAVFAEDWDESNELAMSPNVVCTFSGWPLLGTGTNFIVRKMPEGGASSFGYIFSSRSTRRGIEIMQGTRAPRSRVCKQIRAVRWRGQADRSAARLKDVITELQVLTHHPIMMHDNIIDFLGVLWEYDMDCQVWPVLCLEYADHGTLAALLDRTTVLPFTQKMQLCLDIGNGLHALHECGIVHGDIKPENVFVCAHPELGYQAKIGDFSSSTLNFSGENPKNPLLALGGYTQLWVAPEYNGPAPFASLRLMDVFSFGLVVSWIVHNGKSTLASLVSRAKPANVDDFLRRSKQSPDLASTMVREAQLPGCCNDLLAEDFVDILRNTFGNPETRDLRRALDILRRICKTNRTGERSPFRLVEDFDTGLDGTQNLNFVFKVIKAFPQPLQRQIFEIKKQRIASKPSNPTPEFVLSENSTAHEALQLFRMVFDTIGAQSFGEQVLLDQVSASELWKDAKQALALPSEESPGEDPSSVEVLERVILGSICSGPHSFGPLRYTQLRNQKHELALRCVEATIKHSENNGRLPDPLVLACILALGRPEWMPQEQFDERLKYSHYAGFYSLIPADDSDSYNLKLEALQFAAALRNMYSVVEVSDALTRIRYGTTRAVDSQRLVAELRQATDTKARGVLETDGNGPEPRLFRLAPLVEHLQAFKEELVNATRDIINYRDVDGRTPLLMASLYGNLEAAHLLLEQGADASVTSRTGQSVFHCLPYIEPSHRAEFVKEIAHAGAQPNSEITVGLRLRSLSSTQGHMTAMKLGTPLHHAVLNNSLTSVQALLRQGADPLLESDQYLSPLTLAACAHCPDILDTLIRASKIDVSTWIDHYGNNLLFAALDGEWNLLRISLHLSNYHRCIEKTIEVLRDHGTNWDNISIRYSVPALRFAVFSSSAFMVNQLLEIGLERQINSQEPTIWPPLYQAIRRGDEHIFMLLLDHGADVNVREPGTGSSCLHACLESHFEDQFFLEALLNRGIPVDITNNKGRTAFYEAVIRKRFRAATFLLSRGADPEHKDNNSLTVLGSVIEDGDNILPCVRYLLEPLHDYGASKFVVGRHESTVLHAAAGAYQSSRQAWESSKLFLYLLEKFPYSEHLESQEVTSGFTPLMVAVLGNNVEITKALLAAGASLDTACLAGPALRNAELLVQFFLASYNQSFPGLDFDREHGGRAWMDMLRVLLEASERPSVEPLARPSIAPEEDRLIRTQRFVDLIQAHGLSFLAGHLEDEENESLEIPSTGPLNPSMMNEIEVPSVIMAEFELHLNEKIRQCLTIAQPAGYTLSRQNDQYFFVPHLCWVIETESLGLEGTIGEFLNQFPPFPSIGITLCKHIVDALAVVHGASFVHGALNMSAVLIRTIRLNHSDIPSVLPMLRGFKASTNKSRGDIAVYHRQGNEFDAPEVFECTIATGEFRRPFADLLKCDIYSMGMLIVRAVAREQFEESCGTVETNPAYVYSAIALVQSSMEKEKYCSDATRKLVEALKAMLEADPADRVSNLDSIRHALEACMSDASGGH